MTSRNPSAAILLFVTFFAACPSFAQFAYEGFRQDVGYKVFIYEKRSLGEGRWEFQTKAVFSNGSKPHFSDRRVANCSNSTIDGKVVRAIAQYGYEEGESEVLRAVCGRAR